MCIQKLSYTCIYLIRILTIGIAIRSLTSEGQSIFPSWTTTLTFSSSNLYFYTRQWWSPKTQPPMHFNSTWGPGTGTSLNGVRGAKILPKGFTSFGRRLESVGRQIFLAKQDTAKNTYVVPIFVLLNSFLAFGFWIQKCIQRTSSLLKGVHAPNTFEIARTLVILP